MSSTLYANSAGHAYLDRVPIDRHHRAVLDAVLAEARVTPGCTILEIGAGSGRYTAMLLQAGFSVIAAEPDVGLARKLRERVSPGAKLEVIDLGLCERNVAELASRLPTAVMGFHVLHHLDADALRSLDRWLRGDLAPPPHGVAFLEPNPLNPLYPIQILVHPAMRFREERGLWQRYCGPGSPCPALMPRCHLGLLPPDLLRATAKVPLPALRSPRWAPWSAYRLIGRSLS